MLKKLKRLAYKGDSEAILSTLVEFLDNYNPQREGYQEIAVTIDK